MKKTLLAMAMAAAMTPFTFAAQTPAPAQDSQSKTAPTKKHKKTTKKSNKKSTSASTTPAAKSAK